jgi:hypothetical protein
MNFLRFLTAASIVWAVAALAVQVLAARGGGRRDYSRPAGSAARGAWYNFTTGMLPWNKETARLHAAEFALGVALHAGLLLSLTSVIVLLVAPAAGAWLLTTLWPINLLSLAAGIGLLARRVGSKLLRTISVPDDYLAVTATCGLLVLAVTFSFTTRSPVLLLAYTTVLFAYLPLGKLRHAVFFFVARTDHGRRLGYRGVYPPARASRE